MEKVRRAVKQIGNTQRLSTLSPAHLSLIPLLYLASSLYTASLSIRRQLYRLNILTQKRLPVPLISVGNLTWGGNGKTPMVEYLARSLTDAGISPLILTRGYGGADEARMLQRQLLGTSATIGVGANRAATAARFLEHYGYENDQGTAITEKHSSEAKIEMLPYSGRIGAAILDDGMQHLSLWRDLEIVMVNAMMPWGNHQLIPLGSLREPLTAVGRADIVVIHHADLVQERDIEVLESTILKLKRSVPVFFTKLAPTHFFTLGDISHKMSLKTIYNKTVLCVSGIGCADSFIQRVQMMGPAHVDHLDFSDHHIFVLKDIEMVRARLEDFESKSTAKPVVVVTEKDYDRAPEVFEHLKSHQVLVLCCRLQFLLRKGSAESCFKKIVSDHTKLRLSAAKIYSA